MMEKNIERRTYGFEYEKEERKMVGHAAVFNEPADIGGWFMEQIEPGAFKESIKKDDVRALFNHDPNYVIGRNKAGTLKMKEDERGLAVEINPPDTQFARDLAVLMERGDITQMSFAFSVLEEEWSYGKKKDDPDVRTIKKVRLFDVSPVTYPAYEGTDIAIRSRDAWRKGQEEPEKQGEQETPPVDETWRNDKLRKRLILKTKTGDSAVH
jgi:HK97 family phage prohead protease